jgi:hypothetical protein
VSIHALAGVTALNLLILVAGSTLLWAIRGWRSWGDVARLAGFAYLTGLAVVSTVLVIELTFAVPFGLATLLVTVLLVAVAAVGAARLLHRSVPRRGRSAVTRGHAIVTGVGLAFTIVYVEALFRSARLSGLYEWDAMAFWVPKAKAIYYFGGLDHQFFTTLPGPSYPPLIPALDASTFVFMGSPDSVTLHVMFWFVFVAFLAAIAGLLAPRVHALVLWPCLLLVGVTPVIVDHAISPLADLLLDYFLALAALLLVLWLLEGGRSQIVLVGIFLAAAMLTKREGVLLALCVVAAGMAASWGRRRSTWPLLVAVAAAAFAVTIPWRIWSMRRGIGGGGPEAGYFGVLHHLGRVWPSLQLTLTVLFDGSFWLAAPALTLVAVVAGVAIRLRILPAFVAWYFLLTTLACSWVTASFPSLPLTTDASVNPIVRSTGGLVVPVAGLLPLLLAAAWGARREAVA